MMSDGTSRLTTPPKPVDVGQVFPELAELARTTVRLHPRPGAPGSRDSSMGGPLLWPRGEEWPRCAQFDRHYRFEGGALPTEPSPVVPVLQLFARDVPELPFPEGTDLCQVVWCPLDHEPDYAPDVTVYWRDSASITDPLGEAPVPDDGDACYLPRPCTLAPERVTEFPGYSDVPWEIRQRVPGWEGEAEHDWSYQYHLSVAPGTKVGGWVSWSQDPVWPTCEAGHEMRHLLTIAGYESDGESWKTWTPVEDRSRLRRDPQNIDGYSAQVALVPDRNPADIMIGDAGDLYLFTCTHCASRPIISITQCS